MSRTRQLFLLALFGLAFGESEKQRTGNVCKIDMECPDNAFCRQNSYCVCKDGYVYSAINATNKGCLKEAHNGEACVQNIQCHSTLGLRSECINGICACNPSAHLEDDRCYDTAFIGDRCTVSQNCYLGDRSQVENQAFCVRGYCVCGLQYSPRDNGTRCVKDAGLGEQCEDQLQCAGVGLICRGSCRCKDNWIANNDTKSCVESVEALDGVCEYDVQCDALSGSVDAPAPGAAVCLGGRCSCGYSAHAAGTPARCWHRRWPGQTCRRDEECVAEMDQKAYCRAGRCTCDTCSPDANDFDGANSLSCPMKLIAAILTVAAILRH